MLQQSPGAISNYRRVLKVGGHITFGIGRPKGLQLSGRYCFWAAIIGVVVEGKKNGKHNCRISIMSLAFLYNNTLELCHLRGNITMVFSTGPLLLLVGGWGATFRNYYKGPK